MVLSSVLADVLNHVPTKLHVSKLPAVLVLPCGVALWTALVRSDLLRNTVDASELFSLNKAA